jgi:signal transduction histidine kinase
MAIGSTIACWMQFLTKFGQPMQEVVRLILASAGRITRAFLYQQPWISAIWPASTQTIAIASLLLRQHQQLLNTQQKDLVGRIFKNGKNLLLINDILDFSKIESGCTELEIEEFD